MIYTYSVDFIPGEWTGPKESTLPLPESEITQKQEEQTSKGHSQSTDLTLVGLENFHKFKIMNMLKEKMKKIFDIY